MRLIVKRPSHSPNHPRMNALALGFGLLFDRGNVLSDCRLIAAQP